MKGVRKAVMLFCIMISAPCRAEDKVAPVLEQLDEIVIRVETGISLNSYAESLAQLKIAYKKAAENAETADNPLLSSRMKLVLQYMDDYAKAWRWMEVDKTTLIARPPSYVSAESCGVNTRDYGRLYNVPCVMRYIFAALKEALENAKSAHFNGW